MMEEKNTYPKEQVVPLDNVYSEDSAKAGRLSEDTGAEEHSSVPVEQIYQSMRQREMEILLRVGFPEAVKDTPSQSMSKSDAEGGEITVELEQRQDNMIFPGGNKQNSATASSDIDLSGDEARSAPHLTAEELFQKIRQKEIELLEKAGFPNTLEQPQTKGSDENEAKAFQSGCANGELQNSAAASNSNTLISGRETRSEPDNMTVEEFFHSIQQHDINIQVRSGYPGASYHELDSEDSAYEIVTATSFQGVLAPEDMVESLTSAVYGCFPCCYLRRRSEKLSNPDQKKENGVKNKRPSLLRRLRRFLTRTILRRRE